MIRPEESSWQIEMSKSAEHVCDFVCGERLHANDAHAVHVHVGGEYRPPCFSAEVVLRPGGQHRHTMSPRDEFLGEFAHHDRDGSDLRGIANGDEHEMHIIHGPCGGRVRSMP